MAWQDRCRDKLVTPDAAAKQVKSGDTIGASPFTTTPFTLIEALQARGRAGGVEKVRVEHLASLVSWTEPDLQGIFRLRDNYATPANRAACHAGEMYYLPIGLWRSYELPAGVSPDPDVFLVPVSAPEPVKSTAIVPAGNSPRAIALVKPTKPRSTTATLTPSPVMPESCTFAAPVRPGLSDTLGPMELAIAGVGTRVIFTSG